MAVDYSRPDPAIIERVRNCSDDELSRYLENARKKLPAAQWLVEEIAREQLQRGGLSNMTVHSVREIILGFARQGRTCTYKMIADALNVTWEQAHWRLPNLLGDVLTMEHSAGRPLLSAIVVNQNGTCGDGFFVMARRLGAPIIDEDAYLQQEQQRVFEHWKDK